MHLGVRLGLIGQWVLHISDTAPPKKRFIISHVHSVIRPRGGPWLADFELPLVHCSSAPAERLSVPIHSHPASYSCGRSVIMALWTLSAGSVRVWTVVPPTPVLYQQQASASATGGDQTVGYKRRHHQCSLQQQEQRLKPLSAITHIL